MSTAGGAEGTPGTDWRPGAYYERRRAARWATRATAADADLARRLWEESERLVGLDLP